MVEFIEGAGRGRIDPSGFARIVVRAAGQGDAVARGILMRAGETLGATAAHIVRSLAMEELEFDLVLAGGMFRSGSRDLMDALERTVGAVAPGARPVRLDTPAVVGSVLLALELGGEMPNPDVRAALSEGTISALHLPVH